MRSSAHGGSVAISSRVGEGSDFSFLLPIATTPESV
jgi:signal transduction histidine kinase